MQEIRFPVYFVTGLLFLSAVCSGMQILPELVLLIFIASPFLVVWMVIRVLKDGKPSPYTSNERFYDDWEYRPIPDEYRESSGQKPSVIDKTASQTPEPVHIPVPQPVPSFHKPL